MKKNLTGQLPNPRRSDRDPALDEDLGTFLNILNNLSKTLQDLGYPEEGEMLLGVRADIQQRVRATRLFSH